jgi:hypothetical protein
MNGNERRARAHARLPLLDESRVRVVEGHGAQPRVRVLVRVLDEAVLQQPRQGLLDRKVALDLEAVEQEVLAQLVELVLQRSAAW